VAYLKVLRGADAGSVIPLDRERTVFGRHPNCGVVLDDGAVSRQHAQLMQAHGSYYLEDLRSRNGTQLNDVDVPKPTQVNDGDVIRVCEFLYSFHDVGSSSDLIREDTKILNRNSAKGSTSATLDEIDADDVLDAGERSSIISRIDARSGSGVRLGVKPEAKLRAIMEIGKALAGTIEVDQVLPKLLDGLFQIFPQADQAFVLLVEEGLDEPRLRAVKNRWPDDDSMSISRTIVNRAMKTGNAILSADASEDSRFNTSESLAGLQIRSMMCAPLVTASGDRLGVIQITTFHLQSKFIEDDLDLLVNVATQCTLAIENANLHAASLQQRDMNRELEFAMQVQLGFLPNKRPQSADYEFADFYEAAQHVGGDYFDYIALPDGRIAVTVADVAGKGVPAALLSARMYSAARYHLLTCKTPAEAMSGLNSEISTSGLGHRFITCAIALLDPKRHIVTLVSAGHLPPIHRSLSGQVELVEGDDTGLPLGIIPDQKFKQVTYELQPGDTWVLYTDGATEAMTTERAIYGTKRLRDFIATGPFEIDPLIKSIIDDVNKFVGQTAQSDDLCLVGFQRNP